MKQELYGTRLHINSTSLEHNILFLKKTSPGTQIIAMVKANAYGHGDIAMTKKMEELGISYFGVADFEEGLRLRDHGIRSSIMVMNPGENNLDTIIKNNLEPVIYNRSILTSLKRGIHAFKNKNQQSIPIHIKINTGMNRWGFTLTDIPELITFLKKLKGIHIKSIYSHLSSAENSADDIFTQNQINKLNEVKKIFSDNFDYNIHSHILNSSALIRNFNIANHFNHVRVGILLYGGIKHHNLKPVSELRCPISQIQIINSRDSVGYERKYIAKTKMKIGVIPFGYADGLQRSWGNGRLKFHYKDYIIPTVGNISMDSCTVDLSSIDNISIGDKIIYFGKNRPIWDLASELNTIPYEIMATLSQRIKRVYH